jgi:carbamoyltransferase
VTILGIWDGHDAGAALLADGRLAAAINEERLSRRKLEVGFPARSIRQCLAVAGVQASEVDAVAASTSDVAKTLGRWAPWTRERYYLVRRRQARPGLGALLTSRIKQRVTLWKPNAATDALSRLALRRALAESGLEHAALRIFDHHECHAVGAAVASGLDPCLVLTVDGLGDGLSATTSVFSGNRLRRVASSPASASLGVFFEHVTRLLDMRELEDEGKVMALADYAAPIPDAENPMLPLIAVRNGCIQMAVSAGALRRRLVEIKWAHPNEQFAAMAQRVVEVICVQLALDAVRASGVRRLAIAGGVASNVKATRQIRIQPGVESVSVFPHMGDGGLAVGAALAAAADGNGDLTVDFSNLALGPAFPEDAIASALADADLDREVPHDFPAAVADLLSDGRIVLWFQGRMEWGPRALGNRSVLARPDRRDLRDRLNLVLKRRAWYQPFCPSLLESEASCVLSDWSGPSNRHMTMAYMVAPRFREALAGVIALDGTCRPQVVGDDAPGPFADLLRAMRQRIGLGALLNTSFNFHGEPLVCTPAEAVSVYLRSGADALAMGRFLVVRDNAGASGGAVK